jgi:hypothetical protein
LETSQLKKGGHEGEDHPQAGTPRKGGDGYSSGRCPFIEEIGVSSMLSSNQGSHYLFDGERHGMKGNEENLSGVKKKGENALC